MSCPSHRETKPVKQRLPNDRFIAQPSPEGRRKTCGQKLGDGPGQRATGQQPSPQHDIPILSRPPRSFSLTQAYLGEEISEVETNEEAVPSPEANQSIEGRGHGPKK